MILALDLGSSRFKAGLFDETLALRGSGSRTLRYDYAPQGRVELDADEVVSAAEQAIRAALDEADAAPQAVRAVALTSQAQTFTVVDPAGRARMPFISWQDGRAREACEGLRREPALAEFGEHASFGAVVPALQICQLRHLQEARPGLLSPADRVLSLPTYLVQHWTGSAAVDDNLAAMSGLYSLRLSDWWPAALDACGLRREQLPETVAVGSAPVRTGRGADRFGLPRGVPVVLAGNDQTAGAFGANLPDGGDLLITLGTAQVAYACTGDVPAPHSATIRGPYPGARFYRMAADQCGGNLVNWARTLLSGCETDASFFAQVESAEPGCGGLVFDAEGPGGDGCWCHIALGHTPAELARSLVEELVRRMVEMVGRVDVDRSAARILVAGGGSRSATWVRMLSDALGLPLTVTPAAPLLGAARMALPSCGEATG